MNYLTAGGLEVEGNEFAHDTNEFGYFIRLCDQTDTTLASGAVMIHAERVYLTANDIKIPDFQSVFVDLLVECPADLAKCEIVVCVPESKKRRRYGWDGYSLLNR